MFIISYLTFTCNHLYYLRSTLNNLVILIGRFLWTYVLVIGSFLVRPLMSSLWGKPLTVSGRIKVSMTFFTDERESNEILDSVWFLKIKAKKYIDCPCLEQFREDVKSITDTNTLPLMNIWTNIKNSVFVFS